MLQPSRVSSPRAAALSFLLYLALAVVWLAPASLSPWDTVPDLGDPLHLAYVMAWDAHQLVRAPWALFESNSFYPYPGSLAFGDHLLPEALLVAPVNWLTGNAVLASNLGVLLALSLSGLGMCLLVVRLTGSWGAGFLSGLVYAFNSFTRHELARVHVVSLEWWPLGLLFLDRFVVAGGRFRDALALAACLALQGLSGGYYLVYTTLVLPLWLALAWGAAGRWPARRDCLLLLLAGVPLTLPVAVLVWPYLGNLRSFGFEKPLVEGANLLCYLDPAPGTALAGRWRAFGGCFGLPHFLGLVSLGLMLLGGGLALARRGGRLGWLALATAVAGLALSAGPVVRIGGLELGPGPFRLLHALLPPLRGMDGSKRLAALVLLGGGILAGLGIAWLLAKLPGRLRAPVVAALALVLPLEHWTPPRGAAIPAGGAAPSVYRWLAAAPAEPVIDLPLYPEVSRRDWSLYPFFSTLHWQRIPIGRTSFYPPAHDLLAYGLREFPDDLSLTLLDRLGIRRVVVHPLTWESAERVRRLAALDLDPRLGLERRFQDVLPARFAGLGLGQERVYRILGPLPGGERPCQPEDELPRGGWTLTSLRPGRTPAPLARGATRRWAEWARLREWRTPWLADAARDGDRGTAWTTDGPQRAGDGLEVRLARPETVAAVALELGYPFDEFPRGLVAVADRGEPSQRRLPWADGPEESWVTLQSLLTQPARARMVLRFPPRALTLLTLRIGGEGLGEARPRWTVPEIHIYRACR